MKAAVYHGRRDIRIESVPEPDSPASGEVVLEVVRAAICGTDSSEWAHGPLLTRPPVTLGHEFVGRVVSLGPGVNGIAEGDRVVSGAAVSCGRCEWCRAGRTNLCSTYLTLGLQLNGGLAELVKTPAAVCRRVPETCSDDAAAMAQPLAVALHALRRTNVKANDACAVIGVGGIGSFILGAAAARGVTRLIAVDIDDRRLRTAEKLGAHVTIDAKEEDVAAAILDVTEGDGAHVVIEASGAPGAPETAIKSTRRGGRVLIVGLQPTPTQIDLFALTTREVEITTAVAHICDVDLPESLEIISCGNLAENVLDRVIALNDLVELGIRPLVDRTAQGKIIVDPKAG
jgi:(R,R)-butanediol dehydrogenase/meso-butanediol dehydrogenase/diacetyl reductase